MGSRPTTAAIWRRLSSAGIPDLNTTPAGSGCRKGWDSCYRGLEGYRRYAEVADGVAGGKLYLRRVELIDLGERLLILADAPTDAYAGDIPPSDPFATLAELKDGRVIRSQEYFDHAEALEAAGLSE